MEEIEEYSEPILSKSSTLTQEQLQKIEENKRKALSLRRKKQQESQQQNVNLNSSFASNFPQRNNSPPLSPTKAFNVSSPTKAFNISSPTKLKPLMKSIHSLRDLNPSIVGKTSPYFSSSPPSLSPRTSPLVNRRKKEKLDNNLIPPHALKGPSSASSSPAKNTILNYFSSSNKETQQISTSVEEDPIEEYEEPLSQKTKKRKLEELELEQEQKFLSTSPVGYYDISSNMEEKPLSPGLQEKFSSLENLSFSTKISSPSSSESKTSFSQKALFSSPNISRKTQTMAVPASQPFSSSSTQKNFSTQGSKSSRNDERWEWLEDIRDENMRRPNDPGYDPSTIYIPPKAFADLSSVQKQYWTFKKKHYDTIIFFQQGSFFNVFERDATICVKELGLAYTHGTNRHVNLFSAGININSFDKYAKRLLDLGYSVAKVVEKANPEDSQSSKKKDKISKPNEKDRELETIFTMGTLTDESLLSPNSTFLLSIKEEFKSVHSVHFGICLFEASLGLFYIGEIYDDKHLSNLETMLYQVKPRELIFERGRIGKTTLQVIKRVTTNCVLKSLTPKTEFWDENDTLSKLIQHLGNDFDNWPPVLNNLKENAIILWALGGCLAYLEKLNILDQMISQKNFKIYDVLQQKESLVLDGQTLSNLNILENDLGGTEGTLMDFMNHCITPFGKRLFRDWLCHPLRKIEEINQRLDAIEALNKHQTLRRECIEFMTRLPDLERKISRIHSKQANLNILLETLEGFEKIQTFLQEITPEVKEIQHSIKLKSLLLPGFELPLFSPKLDRLKTLFDIRRSREFEKIIVKKGFSEDFDNVQKQIFAIEEELETFLENLRKKTGISSMKYVEKRFGARNMIEIPIKDIENKKLPAELSLLETLSKVKRFTTRTTEKLTEQLIEVEQEMASISETLLLELQDQFDKDFKDWSHIVHCIAQLDCLISLAETSAKMEGPKTRPEFLEFPVCFEAKGMYHPVLLSKGVNFIPNDISMGSKIPPIILLTGPNMGGKSTLLRQACIIIIMAQIGCFVPAEFCRLSPTDRIFTRIGANDNIMNNQSTFMVELHETSQVLKFATSNSLVILDELGRGTSTFDGYSIAYAVLHYFAEKVKCRTLFSTHYHLLTDEFENHPSIQLCQMKTAIEDNNVIFLYILESGVCPKSYGMNVASMAGIPKEIIQTADQISAQFELASRGSLLKRKLNRASNSVFDPEQQNLLHYLQSASKNLSFERDYENLFELWRKLQTK